MTKPTELGLVSVESVIDKLSNGHLFSLWAAASNGAMTYDSTQGNFLCFSISPFLLFLVFLPLRPSPSPQALALAPGP